MPARAYAPSLPRRHLGRVLTKLHNESGMTVKAVSEEMNLAYDTVQKMLKGRPCKLRQPDIEKLAAIYTAPTDLVEVMKGLATEANSAVVWWHEYGKVIPEQYNVFIGLEEVATSLAIYQFMRMPGLMQTEGYARALFRPAQNITDDERERLIQVRLRRQAVLTADRAPKVSIILDENVIRRMVGSPEVMAEQLRHIAELAQLPNVSIRTVPLDAGVYEGVEVGSFVLLDFTDTDELVPEPPVVYIEASSVGDLYLEKPSQVQRYRSSYADIEQSALSATRTRALLLKMAKELPR